MVLRFIKDGRSRINNVKFHFLKSLFTEIRTLGKFLKVILIVISDIFC